MFSIIEVILECKKGENSKWKLAEAIANFKFYI